MHTVLYNAKTKESVELINMLICTACLFAVRVCDRERERE